MRRRTVTEVRQETPVIEDEYYETMPTQAVYERPVMANRDRGVSGTALAIIAIIVLLIIGLFIARGFSGRSTNINLPNTPTGTSGTTTR